MSNSYKEYNNYSEKDKLSLVIEKLDNVKVAVQNIPQGGGDSAGFGFELTEDGAMIPTTEKKIELSSDIKYVPTYAFEYYFANYQGRGLQDADIEEVVFPEVLGYKDDSYDCRGAFSRVFSGNTHIKIVRFPKLKHLDKDVCNYYFNLAFNGCSNLELVEFPELETITSSNAFYQAFYGCKSLKTMSFPKLRDMSNGYQCLNSTFKNCTSLTDVYFGSIKNATSLTGSMQVSYMLDGCSGVTVHLRKDISGTLSPSYLGGTNIQVVYDL